MHQANEKPAFPPSNTNISRRNLLGAALATIGLATVFGASPGVVRADPDERITVYKSPSCGCCGDWVDHLKDNGFTVDVVDRDDVTPDKQRLGVPDRLYSCHTATVGGYTIEGHVPADDIRRLLAERPAMSGLSVPGMPHGSPGMETGRVDRYAVIGFDEYGNTQIFSRY